jgi:hypothetical protein
MEELENFMLSERSQTQKDKCFMFSFICGIWGGAGDGLESENKTTVMWKWKGERGTKKE